MIGCILVAAAGSLLAARLIHRRYHGWGGHCGGGGWGHHHRRHWGGHHGRWGGGWDGGDFDGPPVEFGGGGGWGRGFFLRRVLGRLEVTPAQERAVRDAVDELRESASKLRGEARKTRADVAGAFRKPSFDAVLFGELFARHDTELESLRKAFVGAGAKIHDALDEKQRARLADIIESRWG